MSAVLKSNNRKIIETGNKSIPLTYIYMTAHYSYDNQS